jgi:hypothetical protein
MPADDHPAEPAESSLERVREVLARHRAELVSRYHAAGAGIGRDTPESPQYVIVVYLESHRDLPAGDVAVEGVRVKFVVTGQFKLL